MPHLRYTDRPAPAPAVVYCDTSFLFDLFMAADPKRLATHPDRTRAKNAQAYFVWARGQNTSFRTSILAVEEMYNALLFSEIKTETRKRGYANWKTFRYKDPADFSSFLTRARATVRTFHLFYRGLGVALLTVGRSLPPGGHGQERVCKYARLLLALYSIDAMDAFHIAVARYQGVDWAATSDSDWTPVKTINTISGT